MQHDHNHANDHHHHSAPSGNPRTDAFLIGLILGVIFLTTVACNYLFADEMLYNWSLAHKNADSVENIQPGQ